MGRSVYPSFTVASLVLSLGEDAEGVTLDVRLLLIVEMKGHATGGFLVKMLTFCGNFP